MPPGMVSVRQPFEVAKACHYYGKALESQGRPEQAGEYSDRAREIFSEIGARGWLRKAGDKQ